MDDRGKDERDRNGWDTNERDGFRSFASMARRGVEHSGGRIRSGGAFSGWRVGIGSVPPQMSR